MIAHIIQPGKLGDLIITAPIAEYYKNLGYKIQWYTFENFIYFFNYFNEYKNITFKEKLPNHLYYSNVRLNFSDYESLMACINFYKKCNDYININKNKEDIILDVSWGFPGAPNNSTGVLDLFKKENRNWIDLRYDLAKVSLKNRWNFKWIRNEKKEDELLKFIEDFSFKKFGTKKYSISHNYKDNKSVDIQNKINFAYINGYEIFDWYKVILNAQSIECVDSSLCNFIEVLPELKDKEKYYLGSEELHYNYFMRNILINNWYDDKKEKIISDYKDKI